MEKNRKNFFSQFFHLLVFIKNYKIKINQKLKGETQNLLNLYSQRKKLIQKMFLII